MLTEKTAVKDVIEACGVPHSEVDLIVAVETYGTERYAVHFGWPVQIPMRLKIFGVPPPADVLPQTQRLQIGPQPISCLAAMYAARQNMTRT